MAPTSDFANPTTFGKRSPGEISKAAAVGIAVLFSVLAIIAVAVITYAYINGWKLPIFQRLAELVQRTTRTLFDQRRRKALRQSQRLHSETDSKSASETAERPASKPAKYWSAEDISRSKIGSVMSHVPSVRAFPTDSTVFKPPPTPSVISDALSGYAQSMFSTKTKGSAFMMPDGTPQVVRPSSKRVKTWSRHISMQFLPDETGPVPPIPSPTSPAQSGEDSEPQREPKLSLKEVLDLNRSSLGDLENLTKDEKRNSRAVVTNLDWMEFDGK